MSLWKPSPSYKMCDRRSVTCQGNAPDATMGSAMPDALCKFKQEVSSQGSYHGHQGDRDGEAFHPLPSTQHPSLLWTLVEQLPRRGFRPAPVSYGPLFPSTGLASLLGAPGGCGNITCFII